MQLMTLVVQCQSWDLDVVGSSPSCGLPACYSAFCHTNSRGVQSLQSSDHLKVPYCLNLNIPFRPLPSPTPTNPSSNQGHVPAAPFVVVPLLITWKLQTIDTFCKKLRSQCFIAEDCDLSATYLGKMSESEDEVQGCEYCSNYPKQQICCDSQHLTSFVSKNTFLWLNFARNQNQKYFIYPNLILFAIVLQSTCTQWKHAITKIT